MMPWIELLADKGYQGSKKYLKKSYTPYKKKKNIPLTDPEKTFNYRLNSVRIAIENVIRCLKTFRILPLRYRNRRKRFGLRFNLISGLYNYELNLGA